MAIKIQIPIILILSLCLLAAAGCAKKQSGPVTKEQAVKIAEREWKEIYNYNEKNFEFYRPYKVRLVKGVWEINGTLPEGYLGGVPYISIKQADGKIVMIYHTK